MMSAIKPIKVFCSYSHQDEALHDKLKTHLSPMIREGVIEEWDDHCIIAGQEWQKEIAQQLELADVVLMLISANFIASDYCYEIEMERALERHNSHEAQVIPIILRPTDWKSLEIGKLQCLPAGAKPVTLWEDWDEAFVNIVEGIRRIAMEMHPPSVCKRLGFSPKQLLKLSKTILDCSGLRDKAKWIGLYDRLPASFQQAIQREPQDLQTEAINLLTAFLSEKADIKDFLNELQKCDINKRVLQRVQDKFDFLQQYAIAARNIIGNIQITTRKLLQYYFLSMPDRQSADITEDLDEMIENLGDYQEWCTIKISPLLVFIERIAQYLGKDDPKSIDLTNWVESHAPSQPLIADLRTKLREEKNYKPQSCEYLLIDLSNSSKGHLRYWLFNETGCYLKDEVPCDTSTVSIRTALQNILALAENKANSSLIIELFVSPNMLSWDPDQWEIPYGPQLGVQYPVLLRWQDRPRRNIWCELTRKIREKADSNKLLTNCWFNANQFTLDQLKVKLSQGYEGEIIGLQFAPFQENQPTDFLMTILYNGVPFAFWPRQEPANCERFQELLDKLLLKAEELDQVPFLVKNFRAESVGKLDDPGSYLTLFWDDPDHDPLAGKFKQPSQRGER